MDFGSGWVEGGSAAALAVPSVIVPREYNYLLNPAHRDFNQISVVDSWPLKIDARLSAAAGGSTSAHAELQDRLLRARAEFENFRKRTERERVELIHLGGTDLVGKMLPILDNLEQALSLESGDENASHLRAIHSRLSQILKESGLEPIEVIGRQFDPNVHHAVDRAENVEGVEDQQIIAEYQRGYSLRGRLLRPAMVKVAVKA
jgi:molecular chaperone GrpE